MDIIKKLNYLRVNKNVSVYRLAEITGINQSTLANTFSRGIVPSVNNLELICSALGISMSQFFSKDENEYIERLNDDESALIQSYRKLSPKLQKSIVNLVEKITET